MAELFKPGDRVEITSEWYSKAELNSGTGTIVKHGCSSAGCCCEGIFEVLRDEDANGKSWAEVDEELTTPYEAHELTKI